MEEQFKYEALFSPQFEKILKTFRKKQELLRKLQNQISKLCREPQLGKPLRNVLRNYRRIHINSHVLIYEIRGREVWLIDFDHHDVIYKKYR